MAAPVAKREAHRFSHHGVTVEDPYAWLKDPNYPDVSDKEVIHYLQAENNHFDDYMDRLSSSVDSLFEEIKARQPAADESVPYIKNGWWYQWRFAKDAQYRSWYRAPDENPEAWEILLDEVSLADGLEFFRLGSITVSPDGNKLAYSADTNGSERFTTRVLDLATRESLASPIANTIDGVVWNADSNGFLYTRVSEEWRPYQVWHHILGTTSDELIYEEADTSFFVSTDLAQSEQYVFISSGGHTHNEVYYLPRENLAAPLDLISARRENHEYHVDHGDGTFVIRSNREQVNFDLFQATDDTTSEDTWQKLVSGDATHYLTDHLVLKDRVILLERIDGLDQIRIIGRGGDEHRIEFPEDTYDAGLGSNPNFVTDTLRVTYTSMVTPNTVFDYDLTARSLETRKVQKIPSGYDPASYRSSRLNIQVRDHATVPLSLVYHKDTPLDGSAPLYLYGYGAYGLSIPPSFSSTRLSLLNRGFIFAIAHIRGGDDLGYQWYLDGKLEARPNTFNDFVDCAKHLIEHNYTSPGRIAIAGGSAGGELMGAAMNQAPELWGAIAAHVPFVDVLNTMLDDDLPLTPLEWPEWGNPITDSKAFALIQSYSPYDQLEARNYPPLLVTAGLNDPRVTYWEPAKFVAKMRYLRTNDAPLLLKTNMGAGHGGKSGRFDSLRETAEEYAFFLDLLSS
ncbi:MAG: prolyl oligopeptidase family serine peptidase [Pseudomonadales bacterium]|nr:prolyl oligopeptidase family serine peptidase [Pseudomonadales bacterium]